MSYKHINELIETHSKPTIFHKKRHEHNQPQNIIYTDKSSFDQKLSNFIESYYQNKKSVAIVTDFDYTLTSRIDYKTGKLYSSSYYLYDEDIIGGDQRSFDERRQALADKYSHYEFSTSYDLETRKEKMKELGMTQNQLADILGIARPTVSQKINGVRMFTFPEAKMLQPILNIPDSEFCAYFFA